MFDIGASELLVIAIVAIIVIGPKDMPLALRTAGRWVGKIRRVSNHFRAGFDAMVREAELEEMEKTWKKQNEEIMARTGSIDMTGPPAELPSPDRDAKVEPASDSSKAEAPATVGAGNSSEPQLPLGEESRKD